MVCVGGMWVWLFSDVWVDFYCIWVLGVGMLGVLFVYEGDELLW